MKISIIIPCYNSEQNLKNCIKSLENQTYKDFEVIFIDDCSTDNTVSFLQNYKSITILDIKIIELKENKGPGNARNVGIESASGEFLSFCDSDDWYENDYLEKMYNTLIINKSDLVMCNYNKVFDNGSVVKDEYTSLFDKDEIKRKYLAFANGSLCMLLIRKRLFYNLELPKLYNGEDLAIVPILILRSKKINHIDDCLYNYYTRTNSLSSRPNPKVYLGLINAFNFIKQNSKKYNYDSEIEFLGIRIILYGAVLNALKAKVEIKKVKQIVKYFYELYPKWEKNIYINYLPHRKKVFIYLVKIKAWLLLYVLSYIHYLYTKK